MKKSIFFIILNVLILSLLIFCTNTVYAAGGSSQTVGVLNVNPAKIMERIVPQEDTIRVYLTVLDYNSWEDIFKVDVILEYYGSEVAVFSFNQYENRETFIKSNTFTETSIEEGSLLQGEKCTFRHSDKKETVDDRCNLELLFVFRTTWFSHLKVIAEDREGLTASTTIEYSSDDLMRSSNIIMIPWLDEPILVGISSFVINFLAIVLGAAGALYFARKMNILRLASYGER